MEFAIETEANMRDRFSKELDYSLGQPVQGPLRTYKSRYTYRRA